MPALFDISFLRNGEEHLPQCTVQRRLTLAVIIAKHTTSKTIELERIEIGRRQSPNQRRAEVPNRRRRERMHRLSAINAHTGASPFFDDGQLSRVASGACDVENV